LADDDLIARQSGALLVVPLRMLVRQTSSPKATTTGCGQGGLAARGQDSNAARISMGTSGTRTLRASSTTPDCEREHAGNERTWVIPSPVIR
jgi:hypothetical protein